MSNYVEEVRDFDSDIKAKESLVEEAKQLKEAGETPETAKKIQSLKRQWKRLGYWESAYEDQLNDEFLANLDYFYEKRQENYNKNKEVKEDIVKRANDLLNATNLNAATKTLNDLFEEWKKSGSAGKETDDELWAKFNEARQAFFDLKHKNWEDNQVKLADAKAKKEAIISEAETLKDATEYSKTTARFNELLEAWKVAGNAGKNVDDELWAKFNEARQAFYTKRNAYYDEVKARQQVSYEAKLAIIEEAKKIVETNYYSKENTNAMKNFNAKWKEAGLCKKEVEDKIWEEYRAVVDSYFAGLTKYNESKQQRYIDGLNDKRNRKHELILKNKQRITRLEREAKEVLSETMANEMLAEVEELKVFIAQLEAEIAELDTQLGK